MLFNKILQITVAVFFTINISKACFNEETDYKNVKVININIDHSLDKWSQDFQNKFLKLASYFNPYTVQNLNKIRLGNEFDGGYVMIDDLSNIEAAYSLGVGDDVSWDSEIVNRNIAVFQYDHTINIPPKFHPLFNFKKLKIGITNNYYKEITTISNILEENSHINNVNLVLKIDIEGDEWEVFDKLAVDQIKNFKQIICEFHNFSNAVKEEWYEKALRVLDKLSFNHRVVHVHANNWSPLLIIANVPFPEVLEVTLLRVDNHTFIESTEIFPTNLDYPNNPNCADIYLGNFKFKSIN